MAVQDGKGRPVAVVTGMGLVTSLGTGKDDNWRALTQGVSGVRRIDRFPTDALRTTVAATVDDPEDGPLRASRHAHRMAREAASEAIGQAGIGPRGAFPGPLIAAVPPPELDWTIKRPLSAGAGGAESAADLFLHVTERAGTGRFREDYRYLLGAGIAESLADEFGFEGQPVSLSTACASGATAIQMGVEAIRRGDTDAVMCLGTDGTVNAESLIRFSLLSALSTQNDPPEKAEKPFSRDRDGFVMGEGAAALVLESLEGARRRGATVLGVVRGCGDRADDYHRTRSKPDGSSIIATLVMALEDAGVDPSDIDYINAHGTGTPENDRMEYLSLAAVMGEGLGGTPISSNKSMIGHTLTAAGAIEAVFSLLTLEHGTLPPTINYDMPDPDIPVDPVANVKRDARVDAVLSNSFGFGGQNVSLVLTREPA